MLLNIFSMRINDDGGDDDFSGKVYGRKKLEKYDKIVQYNI